MPTLFEGFRLILIQPFHVALDFRFTTLSNIGSDIARNQFSLIIGILSSPDRRPERDNE